MKILAYCFCWYLIFNSFGCDSSSSSRQRGNKGKYHLDSKYTASSSYSLPDRYAMIDKDCNRLELIIDTISTTNSYEIGLIRNKLFSLRLEAKDITSDYEASKLSEDIKDKLVDESIDYLLINSLNLRVENLNKKFAQKFDN